MKGLKKQVRFIGLATGAAVMGDSLLYIVLPLYWQEFGLQSIWQVGVLLGINRFIRLPINPLVGYFYTRYPYIVGFFTALFLAVLTTLAYSIFHGFWLLLLIRILWGITWSFLRLGGILMVLSMAQDSNRGELMGTYNGTWGIGALVGMLAGGWGILWIEMKVIYYMFSVLILVSSLILLTTQKTTPTTIDEGPVENHKTHSAFLDLSWLKDIEVVKLIVSAWSVGFVFFGIIGSILPNIIQERIGHELVLSSVTITAAGVAACLQALRWGWEPYINPYFGRWTDKKGNRSSLFPLLLLTASILLGVIAFTEGNTILLLVIIVQLFSSMIVTTSDTLASDYASTRHQVRTMTGYTIGIDLGAAFGPLLAFAIYDFGSLTWSILLASIILLATGLLWVMFNSGVINVKNPRS
ncbi:MFS transporter [Bacillus carboniphilus]|uniref:MFS transporter n=1 Tax=Bacillus carboniphilus TaxID=86663 RepID=A0ABN0W104_9BACI